VIDNSFSLSELVGLAIDFHSSTRRTRHADMPTISNGYVSPWGDVLFTDQPAAQEMFTTVFGSSLKSPTSPPPNTSLETVPPRWSPRRPRRRPRRRRCELGHDDDAGPPPSSTPRLHP